MYMKLPAILFVTLATALGGFSYAQANQTSTLTADQQKIIRYVAAGQLDQSDDVRNHFWSLSPPGVSIMHGYDPIWAVRIMRSGQAFQYEIWRTLALSAKARKLVISPHLATQKSAYVAEAKAAPLEADNQEMRNDYENGFMSALEESEEHAKRLATDAANGATSGKLGEREISLQLEEIDVTMFEIRSMVEVLDWLLVTKARKPTPPPLAPL